MDLIGGATPPDDLDPETVEARRAARRYYDDHQAHAAARRTGRWPTSDGMAAEHHPGDAPPTDPTPWHPDDDPTGRRAYETSTSPHVLRTLTCTHPGCTTTGIYLGTEARLDRTRRAGGPRCAAHPLDPDTLARLAHLEDPDT